MVQHVFVIHNPVKVPPHPPPPPRIAHFKLTVNLHLDLVQMSLSAMVCPSIAITTLYVPAGRGRVYAVTWARVQPSLWMSVSYRWFSFTSHIRAPLFSFPAPTVNKSPVKPAKEACKPCYLHCYFCIPKFTKVSL